MTMGRKVVVLGPIEVAGMMRSLVDSLFFKSITGLLT